MGNRPLELHSHCLTGLAPLVYLEGAKAGCDQLHLSIAPLANGAAQPANQTVIRNLRGMGFKVGTDDDAIDSISKHFAHIADVEGKPVGMPVEFDAFHYEHQIPGGMLSNFREQLATTGLSHKFGELLEECARVRRELAWPIMITPFAQFVGTQAVLNVIHGERYRHVPNEVKKYVLGYYGKLLGPVDPDVFDRIVANGSKDIPLKPSTPDSLVKKMRNRYPTVDDEELLLRMMFAGGQVDQMLKDKGQANPSIVNASVIDLIRTLAKAETPGRIAISRSEFSLAMSKK
jgi:oxaloacetate decarboxylase alpha subunit